MEKHGFCMLVRATDAFEQLLRAYADLPAIIPIHTEAPESYEKWFGDVAPIVRLRDGVGFECGA